MARPASKPRAVFVAGTSTSRALTLPHYCPIGKFVTFATEGSIILADMRGDIPSAKLAKILERIEPVIESWYILEGKDGDGEQRLPLGDNTRKDKEQ